MIFLNILIASALVFSPIQALDDCTDDQVHIIGELVPLSCKDCLPKMYNSGDDSETDEFFCTTQSCSECINVAKHIQFPNCDTGFMDKSPEEMRVLLIAEYAERCNNTAQERVNDHPSNHLRQLFQ